MATEIEILLEKVLKDLLEQQEKERNALLNELENLHRENELIKKQYNEITNQYCEISKQYSKINIQLETLMNSITQLDKL